MGEVGVGVLGMSPVTDQDEADLVGSACQRAAESLGEQQFKQLGFWSVYPNTVRMASRSSLVSQLVSSAKGCDACYLEIGFSTVKLGTPAQLLSMFEELVLAFVADGIKLVVVSQTPMFPGGDSPRRGKLEEAVANGLFANLTYIGESFRDVEQFGLRGDLDEVSAEGYSCRRQALFAGSMIRMRGAFEARDGASYLRYIYLPKEENTSVVDDCIADTLHSIGLAGTAVVVADDEASWIYDSAHKARPPFLYTIDDLAEDVIADTVAHELAIVDSAIVLTPLMRSGATVKQAVMRIRGLVRASSEVSVVSALYGSKQQAKPVASHGAYEVPWENGGVKATVRYFVEARQSTLGEDHWIRKVATETGQLTPWRQAEPDQLTRLEAYSIVSANGMGAEIDRPSHRSDRRVVPQFNDLDRWDVDRLAHALVNTAGRHAKKASGHLLLVFVDGDEASALLVDALRARHEVSTVKVPRPLLEALSEVDLDDDDAVEQFLGLIPNHVAEAILSSDPEEVVVCDESTYSHRTILQMLDFCEFVAGRRPPVACVLANYDNVGVERPLELADVLCFSPSRMSPPLPDGDRSTLRCILKEAADSERFRDFVLYDLLADYARSDEVLTQADLIDVIADRHASCREILPSVLGAE